MSDWDARQTPPTTNGGAADEEAEAVARAFAGAALQRRAVAATPDMTDEAPADLDTIPPHIVRRFAAESDADLQDLRRAVLRLADPSLAQEALSAARRIAHRLKGTAGTVGLDAMAALAHDFEELLARTGAPSGTDAPPAVLDALLREVELLQAARDAAAEGRPADPAWLSVSRGLCHDTERPTREHITARHEAWHEAPDGTPSAPSWPARQGARAPAAEAELLLHVDVRRLDELMDRISALSVNRAALLDAREDATRLQHELNGALLRLAELSERMIDLHPLNRDPLEPSGGETPTRHTTAHMAAQARRLRAMTAPPLRAQASERAPTHAPHPWASATGEALARERATQLDQAMRVLRETVEDAATLEAGLRDAIARLHRMVETHEEQMSQVQRDMFQLRLAPLHDVVTMSRVAVHVMASDLGKRVAFEARGEMTAIDRQLGDALREPLMQLVRNAVAHGIETPVERGALGKPEEGRVWLEVTHTSGEVLIEVGDDGRGMDVSALITAARASGALTEEAAARLSLSAALDLALLPGVSTYGEADIAAGRGMGLDSVRAAVASVKGGISVRSEPGRGAVFAIRVPLALSMARVLRVQVGGHPFGVPFSAVRRAVIVTPADLLPAAGGAPGPQSPPAAPRRLRISHAAPPSAAPEAAPEPGQDVPVYSLAEILGIPPAADAARTALIVEAQVSGARLAAAVLVDGVGEDRELVVRALPRHLRRRAVRGALVGSDGQVVLLLDIEELVRRLLSRGSATPRPPVRRMTAPPRPMTRPRVLVVDDSPTVRYVLAQALGRAGFAAQTARDGLDALEVMAHGVPRAIVLDLEMPRMNGLKFLATLRASPAFAGVRVVVLTATGDRRRKDALAHGADTYLVKPCSPQELVARITELLAGHPDAPLAANAAATTGNG